MVRLVSPNDMVGFSEVSKVGSGSTHGHWH